MLIACRSPWHTQLHEALAIVRDSFTDVSNSADFIRICDSTISEMSSFEKANFQEWLAGITQSMQNGALAVKATDRLLELDARDGHLRVNFNDELVSLIRDVADVSAAGFTVPAKLMAVVESTRRIYRYGIVLKQIAHFYNTVDRQMIASQQPMLLDLALAFEERRRGMR